LILISKVALPVVNCGGGAVTAIAWNALPQSTNLPRVNPTPNPYHDDIDT
jgi:hypothetical protein